MGGLGKGGGVVGGIRGRFLCEDDEAHGHIRAGESLGLYEPRGGSDGSVQPGWSSHTQREGDVTR